MRPGKSLLTSVFSANRWSLEGRPRGIWAYTRTLFCFVGVLLGLLPVLARAEAPSVNPFLGCYDAVSYNGEELIPSALQKSEIRMVPKAEYFSKISGEEIPTLRITGRILGPQGEYERVMEMLVGDHAFTPYGNGLQVTYEDEVFNKLSQGSYFYGYQLRLTRQADGTLLALKIEIDCNCGEKIILRPTSCP